jgi:Undecaprenyl-phosphate glucose phosphotransferase
LEVRRAGSALVSAMLNLPSRFRERGSAPSKLWRLGISLTSIKPLLAAIDAALILLSSVAGGAGYQLLVYAEHGDVEVYFGVGIVVSLIYVSAARVVGLYDLQVLLGVRRIYWRVLLCWALAVTLLTLLLFLLKLGTYISRGSAVCFAGLCLLLLLVWRNAAKRLVRETFAKGAIHGRSVIVVGTDEELSAFDRQKLLRSYGATELDRFVLASNPDSRSNLSRLDAAIERSRDAAAEEIVLALPWHDQTQLQTIRERLRMSALPVRLLPDESVRSIFANQQSPRDMLSIALQRGPLTPAEQFIKRLFDLVAAGSILLIAAPIMMAAAGAIKVTSSGPVVFRQRRSGFDGREFVIYKFRTMSVLEDGPAIEQAKPADPRVTRLGRLLRRTSIDELPQLFNVLGGSMSLVGPRPHALAHNDQYATLIADYAFRHHVKPGITGWAQINGLRGRTPRLEHMATRVEYDLWYIKNWSLWLDVKIVALTSIEVMRGRGAD